MAEKSKGKILIADDDKAIAGVYDLKLRREGFETRIANDGAEALKILEKEKFDLILLDLIMPGLDGFKVLEQLKGRGGKTPVIVNSNLSQEEDKKRSKELGAADFFVKTEITPAEVVEKVKKILK